MLPTPFTVTTDKRQNRSLIQDVTPFLQNIVILTYIISTIKHLTLHHHKPLFKLFLTLLKE